MKLKDYLPMKAIVEDLGVSRWTLWRAARSNLPGFPQPIKVGRQLYWKKSDVDTLEAALICFEGRCVFDQRRSHDKKVRALEKSRAAATPRKRAPRSVQRDLFS